MQASPDGTPATGASLASTACTLTINGQPAQVDYCGTAPYEVIDQLNFVYPSGLTVNGSPAVASLTIDGQAGWFEVPAPTQ
jgi:uncharacterized protein (TIGR03437 family)